MITDKIISWPDGRDVKFEIAYDITDLKMPGKFCENLRNHCGRFLIVFMMQY